MASGSEVSSKDLKVMKDILKLSGITEYEESVLNQMLDFTYRYVTSIIDDAVLYSSHAEKKAVDSGDVKLAICLQQDKSFSNVPTRELTAELARIRNASLLPPVKASSGLRLPPDRHNLTLCNFNLKSQSKKARLSHTFTRTVPSIAQNSVPLPRPVQKSGPVIKLSEANKMPHHVLTAVCSVSTPAQVSAVNSLSNHHGENKRAHEDDDYEN